MMLVQCGFLQPGKAKGAMSYPGKYCPVVGVVLAAATLAACTSQPGTSVNAIVNKPTASSHAAADLLISGQRGYGEIAYATPDYVASIVHAHASSCPSSRPVFLQVAARWRYKGQTVYLTAIRVTFDEESSSLAVPFAAIELTGVVPGGRWVTSAVESMDARGDHTTGWVALSFNARKLSPNSHPVLGGQLWAESISTGKIYCAAMRTQPILPAS
jgi:hypothetical protein